MVKLIKKDFWLNIKSKESLFLIFFFVPLVLIFIGSRSMDRALLGIIFTTAHIFILSFADKEKAKTNILINSLPVTRREIVLSKYLSVFIYYILALVFAYLYSLLLGIFGLDIVKYFSPALLNYSFSMVVIEASILLPFFLRSKSFQLMGGLGMGVFIYFYNKFILYDFVDYGSVSNKLFLISIFIFLISIYISNILYKNLDLV